LDSCARKRRPLRIEIRFLKEATTGVAPTELTSEFFAPFAARDSFLRALRVLRGEYSSTVNPEQAQKKGAAVQPPLDHNL